MVLCETRRQSTHVLLVNVESGLKSKVSLLVTATASSRIGPDLNIRITAGLAYEKGQLSALFALLYCVKASSLSTRRLEQLRRVTSKRRFYRSSTKTSAFVVTNLAHHGLLPSAFSLQNLVYSLERFQTSLACLICCF